MRLLSILARVGLVFLGAVLVTAVSADVVWEGSSDEVLTTSDLSSALFGDWALPFNVIAANKRRLVIFFIFYNLISFITSPKHFISNGIKEIIVFKFNDIYHEISLCYFDFLTLLNAY